MRSRVANQLGAAWRCSVVALALAFLPPVLAQSPPPPAGSIRPAALEGHVRFLASDLLEGREAGTRGYDLAAAYVAAQFQQLGLRPAGDHGTYMQAVPLRSVRLVADRSRVTVGRRGARAPRLTLGRDYIVESSPTRTGSDVSAPGVFVGYGIEAPSLGHDDYAGLDVRGKVVVALFGYPSTFPSEEGAHYGSGSQKEMTAAAHGAVGLVTVYTERAESVFPWSRASDLGGTSMAWVGPDGRVAAGADMPVALMSPAAGAALFDGAPRSYQDVRAEAATGAPKGFPLAVTIGLAQQSRHEPRSSANVAAVLEGSDPVLRQEYVVVLAHLDHEGLGPAVNGDRIYNGALDNAAGVAALIETARALTTQRERPRRSIVFLAVTAEEKGMVGSDFFARHPTVPKSSIVAAVNLDMPVLLYDFTDVIAFGAEHSSLKSIVARAAADADLTVTPDPMPDQAIFTRSDHYSFVQQGVPSVLLATGWNSTKGPGEGGKVFLNFLGTAYHQPQDDVTQPIDYVAGARFADVNYRIARMIADDDARPSWNAGDFFGRLFGTPGQD